MTEILDWINAHPEWSGLVIFTLCYLECLFLLGALIPGVVLLFAAAALVGSSDAIPMLWMLLLASTAGFLGDLTGFILGLKSSDKIHGLSWIQKHRHWLDATESFFNRWGALGVIIGRFVGPIRPFTPFLAGTLGMPFHKFAALSFLASLGWAPVYLLPGYFAGRSVDTGSLYDINYFQQVNVLTWVSAAIALAILAFALINYSLQSHRSWMSFSQHIAIRLGIRELPLPSLILTLTAFSTFLWLSLQIPLNYDFRLMTEIVVFQDPFLFQLALISTLLGDPKLLVISAAMIAILLMCSNYTQAGIQVIIATSIAVLSVILLKQLFAISRPTLVTVSPQGFAFPSGHAAASTVFFGLLAAFFNESRDLNKRWQLYLLAAIPISIISFSRVYLGVHWLSDILGGVIWGLCICGFIRTLYGFSNHRQLKLSPLMLVFGSWLALVWLAYLLTNLPLALENYAWVDH